MQVPAQMYRVVEDLEEFAERGDLREQHHPRLPLVTRHELEEQMTDPLLGPPDLGGIPVGADEEDEQRLDMVSFVDRLLQGYRGAAADHELVQQAVDG